MPTTPATLLLRRAVPRDDVQQLVAVVAPALGVDHHDAVGIAVERDAEVGSLLAHRLLQRFRRGGADAVVDVEAVGLDADRDDFGAELVEHVRRDVVGGAVGAVDHDLHALQVQLVGNVVLQNSM